MLKTAGYAFAVCAIGTLAIAWSHTQRPQQKSLAVAETISPESIMVGHRSLPESKFNDMSFVFTDAN
jgi:hypothetical protein